MMAKRRRASPCRGNMFENSTRHFQSLLPGQLTIFLLLLLSITSPVVSTPISYFPLNSQLPPVARVAEPFSFVFSPLTFSSDTNMSYALADGAPSWLSLDSTTRKLSGTPDGALIPVGETLVGVVIGLVASDDTGSTTANATLVVSRAPAPVVRIPFIDQAERFGPHSAPASVLLHPSSEFSFDFDPNTFGTGVSRSGNGRTVTRDAKPREDNSENASGKGPQFNYYAVSGDNAPLPSWVSFDSGKLAFSGKTPAFESLVQPPQKFDIQLVASDVVGFSSAAVDFSIVVGPHELTAEASVIELNATIGKRLEYTGLPDILKLDKQPLRLENVSSITADGLPPWLSFDEKSWRVSGTPDPKAEPANITIVVMDNFFDTLNITLELNFHTKMFVSDLPSLGVSAGDDILFDLKSFLFEPADTRITAEIQPDDSWIRFDDLSKTLSGTAPKVLAADYTNGIRVTFKASQLHTKDKEAKDLDIHITELPPAPSPEPDNKAGDSNKGLYWLIIIPAVSIPSLIILIIFRVRRRRYQPKKLDFSEVSGPVPGSFAANGFMDVSSDSIGSIPDADRHIPPIRPSSHTPAGPSELRTSQTEPNSNIRVENIVPHAMTMFSGAIKLAHPGNETRGSWFAGRQSRVSPAVTDEISLLSDTSLGEDVHISEEDLSPKKLGDNMHVKKTGLEVPTTAEPFSIQPTPELAYAAAGRYDYVSDDGMPPPTGRTERRKSGRQQHMGAGLGGVQNRLSGIWKRGSVSKLSGGSKRHSQLSESTEATTRTSILTSGVTEEATTSTNVVAKPTVIHIPSRPGEARQVSRRTDDSSTFFGGRSLTKSQRNFGLVKDTMPKEDRGLPATSQAQNAAQDSGTTWEHLARNSLGIAYQDLIKTNRITGASFADLDESGIGLAQSKNWNAHHTNSNLISPNRWPKPDAFLSQGATTDVFRSQNDPPQLPPFTLPARTELVIAPTGKGKRRASFARRSRGSRGSVGSIISPLHTPSTHGRSRTRNSREERLRLSRIREQKALDEFRAMMSSQTPSPYNEWAAQGARQTLETPSRASRAPLTDRFNESRGLKSTLSKRSVKTARSNKSMRSGWGDNDDDEDAWEDIRPPESIVGGWEAEASDRSFPVYI